MSERSEQVVGRSATNRSGVVVIGVLLVILAIAALLVYRPGEDTALAGQKADQLIAELDRAGLSAPSKEQIVRVLGDDGGAVCVQPTSALKRATLYSELTNGAAGPGQRPVIADRRTVQGLLLIIEVYCPERLPGVRRVVDDLNLTEIGST